MALLYKHGDAAYHLAEHFAEHGERVHTEAGAPNLSLILAPSVLFVEQLRETLGLTYFSEKRFEDLKRQNRSLWIGPVLDCRRAEVLLFIMSEIGFKKDDFFGTFGDPLEVWINSMRKEEMEYEGVATVVEIFVALMMRLQVLEIGGEVFGKLFLEKMKRDFAFHDSAWIFFAKLLRILGPYSKDFDVVQVFLENSRDSDQELVRWSENITKAVAIYNVYKDIEREPSLDQIQDLRDSGFSDEAIEKMQGFQKPREFTNELFSKYRGTLTFELNMVQVRARDALMQRSRLLEAR